MTPEHWQQVEEVFQSALDCPPGERQQFIAEACAHDADLREQVEALVRQHEAAGDFIEAPAFDFSRLNYSDTPIVARPAPVAEDDPMAGRRIGAYKLVREIGRGGMGAVYLAVRADSEFQKRVAIKLIKRGMDTDFILRRFRNERQILASLDHPHIARLLDGGTTDDGLPYFVMEYIEGQPLYSYCDSQKLTIAERLRLFFHVCGAVQYAHQNLVVHRDIKPGNILVCSDGTPKLLDFGIAKLLNPEMSPDTITPTATAMRLMTPEYASPEQVQGLAATPASDVYSLGVLLYELLTGHRPYHFRGRAPHEIARVICEEEPEHPSHAIALNQDILPPEAARSDVVTLEFVYRNRGTTLEELRRELTGDLDNIVLKALRKEPGRRYATAEKLREDITRHLEGRPISAPFFFPVAGAATRPMSADAAAVEKSIAVLPFKIIGLQNAGETGDNFLGVGLADALITRLSSLRQCVVRPTSSVLRYGDGEADPFSAGHELGVKFVLDGHIRRAGARIRVTVQLLSVGAGATVWASQFDEDFTDVLSLEDALSTQVAEALVPQLTGDERLQLAKRGTDDAEAYETYLRGRYYWNTFTEDGFAKAITSYYRAIALDPTYAAAYTGVAEYYIWLGIYGVLPPAECFAAAKEAAAKAVELDDSLAEAHTALGLAIHTADFQWSDAESHFRRALELNPNYSTAHLWYSLQLAMEGRFDESLPLARRALELDPLTPFNRHNVGWCLYHARRFDESIEHYRQWSADEPEYGMAHHGYGWVLRQVGRYEESIAEATQAVEMFGDTPFIIAALAASYAAAGKVDDARKILRQLEEVSTKRYVSPYHLALVHYYLDDKEGALRLLEQTHSDHDAWIVWLGVEPQFDALRDEPRFVELLRRTNNPAFRRQEADLSGRVAQPENIQTRVVDKSGGTP